MRNRAQVVVVGSGIIGASIALQLARHGLSDVLVLDRAAGPGEGSTGASSSISRCRYTNSEVIRLAFDGQRIYGAWPDFTGLGETRARLHRTGVLWMLGETRSKTEGDAQRLRAEGVEAETLDVDEFHRMFPMLSDCAQPLDLTGEVEHVCQPGEAFLLEPGGGYVDPVGANQDLIEAARSKGVSVEFNRPVTGLLLAGERVAGVQVSGGHSVAADLVVNAAGPWCNSLNDMAGFTHRWTLNPTRAQTVYRRWPAHLGRLPVAADSSSGIYFRSESAGNQVLIGSVRPEDEMEVVSDPDQFKRTPDPMFTERTLAAFHHRVPDLEARGPVTGTAGLYTINREDVHPIVGPTGIDGFWVANGFSGHGFKLAPAIGSMIARSLTGVRDEFDTDVDIAFFAVDREPIDVSVKGVLA